MLCISSSVLLSLPVCVVVGLGFPLLYAARWMSLIALLIMIRLPRGKNNVGPTLHDIDSNKHPSSGGIK